jgi:hypothetical protein
MTSLRAGGGVREQSLHAIVTRRDAAGNVIAVEDLGKIAYWHKSPIRRLFWKIGRLIHGAIRH